MVVRILFLFIFFNLPMAFAMKPPPFFDAKELTPYWPSDSEKERMAPATVLHFQVIDQNNRSVSEASMKGHLSLVNFFFASCPGVCPVMMKNVQAFRKKVGPLMDKVQIYSFSVDPEKDSASKLKIYAQKYQLDLKHWSLLTGKRNEIYHVGKDMFKADGSVGSQKAETSFIHTRNIYLVDRELRIRGIYDTSDVDAMKLLSENISQLEY